MTNDENRREEERQEGIASAPTRRPYRAPKLRSLGSVREVTWGGSPTTFEGALKGTPMKM